MSGHRIRLAGPWEATRRDGRPGSGGSVGNLPVGEAVRVTLPAAWRDICGHWAGEVTLARRFQWPTVLDEGERVWLVVTGYGGTGEVTLNGLPLGRLDGLAPEWECDVTDRLESSNRLVFTLTFDPGSDPSPGGLYAPVYLEVRSWASK